MATLSERKKCIVKVKFVMWSTWLCPATHREAIKYVLILNVDYNHVKIKSIIPHDCDSMCNVDYLYNV